MSLGRCMSHLQMHVAPTDAACMSWQRCMRTSECWHRCTSTCSLTSNELEDGCGWHRWWHRATASRGERRCCGTGRHWRPTIAFLKPSTSSLAPPRMRKLLLLPASSPPRYPVCVCACVFLCVWWEVGGVGGEGGGSCLHPPPAPSPRASTLDMSEPRFVEVEAGGQLQTCEWRSRLIGSRAAANVPMALLWQQLPSCQCRSRLKLSILSSRSRL